MGKDKDSDNLASKDGVRDITIIIIIVRRANSVIKDSDSKVLDNNKLSNRTNSDRTNMDRVNMDRVNMGRVNSDRANLGIIKALVAPLILFQVKTTEFS